MTAVKHYVTIKGVKDGLIFLLDDTCEFALLLSELQHKLDKTHQRILSGPAIHVHVKLGKRKVSDEEKEQLLAVIGRRGNLIVQSVESEPESQELTDAIVKPVTVMRGVVRSGQTIRHEGDLLYVGDVNPGGTIECTGDIYIMGALRGTAHAGAAGDEKAIIAASYLRPTQLRISGIISRPPDEWGIDEAYLEFAYIRDGKMEIDKISHLHRMRS